MILDRIVADKKQELSELRGRITLMDVKSMARDVWPTVDFASALMDPDKVSIIAEVKKASPSRGIIRVEFDPVEIALNYEMNGAKALSVLTEKRYFMGDLDFVRAIKAKACLPVLRKDFIFDEYQVYETRAAGADALLLIAAILEESRLNDLYLLAKDLGLETLAEVHDEEDLEKVLDAGFTVVGINNRNLKTFEVDIKNTGRLIKGIPYDRTVVSESGISTKKDMQYLKKAGADAVLIGEAFMREADYGAKLRELAGL